MNNKITKVAVFGSSWPKPGHQSYSEAIELGHLLGVTGFTVLTGGYIGTMEAVSRGASESGAHVIGFTCDEIERFRPIGPNAWVKEEQKFPTLRTRILGIIEACDAALALPGGVGTLTEVSLMWDHLLIGAIAPRPLILIGSGWNAVIGMFFQFMDQYVPPEQRAWITLIQDNHTAVQLLHEFNENE